jgi:hypothetical protein
VAGIPGDCKALDGNDVAFDLHKHTHVRLCMGLTVDRIGIYVTRLYQPGSTCDLSSIDIKLLRLKHEQAGNLALAKLWASSA